MATGVTSPSSFSAREKTNFIRLSRLLIDVGRRVFQDVFDSMHPPSTLHAVLNSIPVKNKLLRLQSCKVLHTQQWNLLYPTSGIAQSKDFDITLLFLLLRNFCGLRAPSSGWNCEPLPTDLTMEDDLVRIKLCRNMIYAHIVEMALTDDEFESYWDKIEAALNRLGKSKYKTQIEHLKFTSIDHEMNNCYHALVQSWEEMKCNANQQEYTMIIRGIIKTLTAGGTILAWTAGSAYFLMRYREDPETVIRLVREAIVPSGFATSAIVYALLPGSFKILVEINSDALDYISRSLNDGSLRKNLENVIVTDKLCHLAPDGTKKVLLSVVSLEVLLESHTSNEQKKDLELREYQKELARPAMEGRNAIICAPTNSGKTFVAMAIAKHHLVQFSKKDDSEELGAAAATKSTSNGKPKVIFIVSNLVLQQRSRFEEYLTNYSISDISGSNSTEIPLDFLLKTHDVIVLTAQILLNALQKGSVKISQITLLVFDECHHTNKDHNYNKIMQNYMALKYQSDPNIKLPQIVGLTASFGTRRSNTTQNTQNYILQICANMDASCISTVRTNLKELKKNVTGGVPRRKLEKVDQQPNVFENVIVQVMEKIEIAAQTVSPTSIVTSIPPADRVGQQYRQWVEGIEKEAISKALRDLSTYAKHLKRYHIALLINDTVRTKDAIQYLQEFFDNLDQGKFLSSDKKLQELFEKAINGIKSRIEKTEPKNPKLEKLKELILKFYEEDKVKDRKGETKGILFTKTRDSTKGLMGWIQETDELKSILRPKVLVGAGDGEVGMTQGEQEAIIEEFKKGEVNILIATTVAEEGLDIGDCNFVIRYNMAGNKISSYVYRYSRTKRVNRECLNQYREILMTMAVEQIQQMQPDDYMSKITEIQRSDLRKFQMRNFLTQFKKIECKQAIDNVVFFCRRCNKRACHLNEFRIMKGTFHVILEKEFKHRINIKPKKKSMIKKIGDVLMDSQVHCKECDEDWGSTVKIDGLTWPCLKIRSFAVQLPDKKRTTYKKWSDFHYEIPEATIAEIIEMDDTLDGDDLNLDV